MPECISNHVKVPRTMSKVLKYSVSPNTLQKVFQVSPRWTSTGICITAAPIHQSFSHSHLPLLVHKTLRHLNSSSWVRNSSPILFQLPWRFGSADFHFPRFTFNCGSLQCELDHNITTSLTKSNVTHLFSTYQTLTQ